jgi:hypothetical protein
MLSNQTPASFLEYSDRLAASAQAHPDVVGLVLVGSAADTARADEWSDHDFFLIVRDGMAEGFRQDLSWLPDADQVIIRPRETAHGLKVVYRDGRVLEFAVFDDSELEMASVNYWAVPVDKTNITTRVAALEKKTVGAPFEEQKEWELLLAHILIGVGRARRGEALIAGQQIRSYMLRHVVGFVRDRIAPAAGAEKVEDNLDRFRRFEQQYPAEGSRLDRILQLPVEEAAQGLLDFTLGLGGFTDFQHEQADVVRRRLGWD